MRSERTKTLIRKIAKEEGLDVKQVEEIVNSFFRFTAKRMTDGDRWTLRFNDIRLFKFGLFEVTESKKRKTARLNPYLKKKREKLNRIEQRNPDNLFGSIDDQRVQENMDKGQISKEG